MESQSTRNLDKLAHFIHQLKTVPSSSDSFKGLIDHLRNYLKRNPQEIRRLVISGGIPPIMRIIQPPPAPPSPFSSRSSSSKNTTKTQPSSSVENSVLESGISLLGIVVTDEMAKIQLTNESAVKIIG